MTHSTIDYTLYNSAQALSIPAVTDRVALAKTLRDSLGLSPLPIAPASGGKFTGKNPSYVDPNGTPQLIQHKEFQTRLPTDQEIEEWFTNPANGIGYLHTTANPGLKTVDLDRKHFDSQAACDAAMTQILGAVPTAWVDQTPSGGYHIAVALNETPGFTNFGIEGVHHAGELLGVGRFVAMAPTPGYSRVQDGAFVPTDIDSLGVRPTGKGKTATKTTPRPRLDRPTGGFGSIPLELLGTPQSLEILTGGNPNGDRSQALALAAQEWFGWENWCCINGIEYRGSAEELAQVAGEALGIGPDRVDRILATVDANSCTPSAQHRGGDDSCWKRVAKLDRRYRDKATPAPQGAPSEPTQQDPTLEKADRLKLELKALGEETDPVRRMIQAAQICSHYQISKKDLEQCLQAVTAQAQVKEVKALSLAEFYAQTSDQLEWLIPGLLPVGETALLIGSPGVGKSLLTTDLAFAVATGEASFLGENPTKRGKVLYISVDESPTSTKSKFLSRGLRDTDENLKVIPTWDISQMKELEAVIEDFRPDLVILDSLKRITLGTGISENEAAFADAIYKLKEVFQRYGAAAILIHHANKGQGPGVDKVRGSTAIAGATWGVWQLDKPIRPEGKEGEDAPPMNENERIFSTPKMRDSEELTLTLELDSDRLSYVVRQAQGETVSEESKTLEKRILDYLEDGTPRSKAEIFYALGGAKATVYRTIAKLVSRKIISQRPSKTDRRAMVVQLKKSSQVCQLGGTTPPPLSVIVENETKFSETLTTQGFEVDPNLVSPPEKIVSPSTRETISLTPCETIQTQAVQGMQRDSLTSDENIGGGGGETNSTVPVAATPTATYPTAEFLGNTWYVGSRSGKTLYCPIGLDPTDPENWIDLTA